MKAATLLLVGLAACGGGETTPTPDALDAAPSIDAFAGDPLAGVGTVELVDDGYQFVEGPAWDGTSLVFSDIPASTIYRYTPGGGAPVIELMPSDMSNGLTFDAQGRRLAAEHGSRTVTRLDGGTRTAVASSFEGQRLNSPNDLVVAADGSIYFTDPPYGISGAQRELPFMGVFRLAGGVLTTVHRGPLTDRPNGIGIAPDGRRLYVADSANGNLYRFPLDANGVARARELHATTAGAADGLALDEAGNVFVATSGGIEVFAPDGSRWGAITVPEQPANCAFGDADHRTLYITAQTSLYKVRLANPGLPGN